MKKIVKRNKAWLGAVIGTATNIAGSIIGGNAQKKAARAQARAQNRQATLEMANNLSNAYGDQEYVDDFQNKIAFRNGGRVKRTKLYSCGGKRKFSCGGKRKFSCGGKRKFSCGGRKRYEDGGLKLWDGANDLGSIISGVGSSVGGVIQQNGVASAQRTMIQPVVNTAVTAKQEIKKPSYLRSDNVQQQAYRCGGYILKRRK